MHSLLLVDVNEIQIDLNALRRAFHLSPDIKNIRENTPAGIPIEADFVDGRDFTTVALNTNRESISIRGTSGAALRAAWVMKQHLGVPLRLFDTEYTFDLLLSEFSNFDDLERAIDRAQPNSQ